MRTGLTVAGILIGTVLGGLLLGALGGLLWVSLTDDDPPAAPVSASVSSPSVSTAGEPSPSSSPTAGGGASQPTFAITPTATVVPLQTIAISGDGDRTEPLPGLNEGIAVVTFKHDGDSRFRVALSRGDGEPRTALVNGTGALEGSRVVYIAPEHEPALEVAASGSWEVTIERPLPTADNTSPLPFEASGSGSRALYYVDVPNGTRTMTATHTGDGPFTITVMNEVGRMRSRVIQAEGGYEGSAQFVSRFFPGSKLLIDVRATGDWTLKIE